MMQLIRPSSLLTTLPLGLLTLLLCGCKASTSNMEKVDSRLVRYQKDAHVAYDEGQLQQATKLYRKALYRAWAIDDPYESGTAAYNLAATLVSRGQLDDAQQWLVNARVDLCRVASSSVCPCGGDCDLDGDCDWVSDAKTSMGNTWLLSSSIAIEQNRYALADQYINRAACAAPPCESADSNCLCGPGSSSGPGSSLGACFCFGRDPCDPPCGSRVPCVGRKIKQKKQVEDCQNTYYAQVQLARARLAVNQYDVSTAVARLRCACDLMESVCDCRLQADRHDVAALIHLANEQPLAAAGHFDRQADYLRVSGTYREIPKILDAAAAAYEVSGRYGLAADRLCRSARIWLVRGDLDAAWQRVRQASELAVIGGSESATVRLTLVAKEIERQVDREEKMIDEDFDAAIDLQNEPEIEPLDPDNVEPLPPPSDSLQRLLLTPAT